MNINNETIGISAEVAIAESFKVPVSDEYILRSDKSVVNLLQQKVLNIFTEKDIPVPVKHVAEGQNSIDFILELVRFLFRICCFIFFIKLLM